MKTVITRLIIAAVLALGAWLSWSEAKVTGRVADARERLATLDLRVDDDLDRRTRTTIEYWLGRYGDVMEEANGDLDAEVLLAAANAAFRSHERDGAGPAQVPRLDGVLQAYAAVLKAAPKHMDAAYNYEYVSRVRDQVARNAGKPVKETPRPGSAPRRPGDLPAGPTVHGRPGGPPPEMKAEEMDVIAPMNYGDREAQPEATPGVRRERKG